MGRIAFSIVVAIGLSALLTTVGPDTIESTDRAPEGAWTNTAVCVAHGSTDDPGKAARKKAKGGNGKGKGGGGGGKTKVCAKTFGSWNASSLDVYVSDAAGPGGLVLTDYVTDAFEEWACHSGIGESLTINYVGSAAGADITVVWGNLGSGGTLGSTTSSMSGSTITHGSVVMNSNQAGFDWAGGGTTLGNCNAELNDAGGPFYDLLSVTIHEIGHALGIDHPTKRCRTRDSCYAETMYSCTGPGEISRRALNEGDKVAISFLYGND